jgi:type IX secretion system PorP/SprF family membrane protein
MKKFLTPIVALLLGSASLWGQQDHQYTQFMYNKLLLNPAYAGARGVSSISAIYRNQWAGFEGAPKSALLSLNAPFLSPRVGVGVVLSHQQAGLQRDFFGSLAYSYDLVAEENLSLRVGVQGSIRSLALDFADAEVAGSGGAGADPSLQNQRINDVYGNVGAGVYATIAKRAYVGFALPRIYSNTIGLNTNPQFVTAKEYRHYYAMAGAIIPISKDIQLMPAVLGKYVQNAPFDADLNLNLGIKEKVTIGLSGRLGGDSGLESVDLLAFFQANEQIGIGAAYDFPLSRIKNYTAGSFEVMVQADLQKPNKKGKKSRKNLSNPRFFM